MTPEELRAADCWFAVDHCPRDPATTDWKRRARLHQARWRKTNKHPIGAHAFRGNSVPVGSRLVFEPAKESGTNFLTENVLASVYYRLSYNEKHEMIREERLWADLLSSMPMCFNLFGDLWPDSSRAQNAVSHWWPEAPRGDAVLRFEYSPGRLKPLYLNNKSAFDAAFCIAGGNRTNAIVGIETKYHEHPKRESIPGDNRLPRYVEVTERSNAFVPEWRERILGTHLQQIWLDHLLVLAMLQHPSDKWSWGRFVLVYPANNPAFARLAAEYAGVLRDVSTYEARTIESLLDTPGTLDEGVVSAFRDRYLL